MNVSATGSIMTFYDRGGHAQRYTSEERDEAPLHHEDSAVAAADDEQLMHSALQEGAALRERLRDQSTLILSAAAIIGAALRRGGKLLLCGDAAGCQHLAAEFQRPGLAALALTADLGHEHVFSRQVAALGRTGDVLLCLSSSGCSPSVLGAAERARELGLRVLALSGPQPGPLGDLADLCIAAPGSRSDRVYELHVTLGHILCALVERAVRAP